MSQPKILTDVIDSQLKPAGFKRKASTWYKANTDTIVLLNLQKSSYGPQYYINIAVWLRAFGDVDTPKENECHIRLRWESIVPGNEKHLERLLDLENGSLSDAARISEIELLVRNHVLPFLLQVSSLMEIRSIHETNSWPRGILIHRKARDLLTPLSGESHESH